MQFWTLIRHCRVRNARVKPYIHNVVLFGKLCAAALFTLCARRKNVFRVSCIPRVTALFCKQGRNICHGFLAHQRFTAVFAVENRNRNTPAALTGNAPVVAFADHGSDAITAPCGNPFYLIDFLDSLLLNGIDGAEPLLRCAEQNRLLAAPAVRILMDNFLPRKHSADFHQIISDCLICLLCCQTGKALAGFLSHTAVRIDRN